MVGIVGSYERRILSGIVLTLLAGGLLWGLTACRQEDRSPPSEGRTRGAVHATEAYLRNFGQPPTPAEGTCYALVGYYPAVEAPDRIRPFPLFIFDRDHQMQIVAEQLLHWGEGWDLGGIMVDPFPPGVELLSLERQGDMVRLELTGNVLEETTPATQKVILDLFTQTLTQFDGVERVMMVGGGVLFPYQAKRAFMPDPAAVLPPGPPGILMLTGTWEEDGEGPVEVSVLFDRPVEVDLIRLRDAQGRELAGDYYRSMFNMAVVVHPSQPEVLREGESLTISWRISDGLERTAEDEGVFPLEKIVRPRSG